MPIPGLLASTSMPSNASRAAATPSRPSVHPAYPSPPPLRGRAARPDVCPGAAARAGSRPVSPASATDDQRGTGRPSEPAGTTGDEDADIVEVAHSSVCFGRRGDASVGQWLEAADGGDDLFGHQLKRMKGAGADDCAVGDLHAQLRERAQVFDCLGYPLAPLPEVESGLHRLLDLGVVAPLCRAVFAQDVELVGQLG